MTRILAFALLAAIAVIAAPQRAKCGYCPTYSCYSSDVCGHGCLCLGEEGPYGAGTCTMVR
jgi:hypothetical protein